MTALADAFARAQSHGAKQFRLKNNGYLKRAKVQSPALPYNLAQLAEQCDHDNETRHNRDLGLKDPLPQLPRSGFQVAPILSTTRLARPGKGDHTRAFALRHSCDMSKIGTVPTTNFVPERPRVSKALLVRKLMRGKKCAS